MDILDFLSIIFLVIVLGLFVGLIYLIYLPFKRRLIKSDKLTDKLNRQINRAFILLFCLLGAVIYFFKDYGRTPSKDRLEKISNVILPADFKVLKDEYHDMMQDYAILYDIEFDKKSTTEFIKSIKTSKFYNVKSFHTGAWKENDFIVVDRVKAVWSKSPKGFDFSGQEGHGLPSYYIELDTVINILKYEELD